MVQRERPPCTSFSYSALNSCRSRGDYVDGAQAGRRTSKGQGGPVLWHRLSPGTTLKKKKKKNLCFLSVLQVILIHGRGERWGQGVCISALPLTSCGVVGKSEPQFLHL